MASSSIARARLRSGLARHLRRGFERAVFAPPGGGTERVRPGRDADDNALIGEVALASILEWAAEAVDQEHYKLTVVLDATRRLKVDLRHGHVRKQVDDPKRLQKIMGGKDRLLRPDTSPDLLRELDILNPDGTISAKAAKKYKQIDNLARQCQPLIERLAADTEFSPERPLRVVDFGCGKSSLGFVLCETLRLADIPVVLRGVDLREDLVVRSQERAEALGLSCASFVAGRIGDVARRWRAEGFVPDATLSLHACDTATDEALACAIGLGVPAVLAVPCCQAELAQRLVLPNALPPSLGDGLLRREFAALATDALRVEALRAHGYRVDVLEFVSTEHTPKNLLIRATRAPKTSADRVALEAVQQQAAALGASPMVQRLASADPLATEADSA